jgi:ATP synthase protein I
MKLLRPNTRVNTEDSLGHGLDAVIVLLLFAGGGFLVDRWLETVPVFTIVLFLLGSVGLFAKFKYRYEQRMDEHEAARLAKLAGPTPDRTGGAEGPDGTQGSRGSVI